MVEGNQAFKEQQKHDNARHETLDARPVVTDRTLRERFRALPKEAQRFIRDAGRYFELSERDALARYLPGPEDISTNKKIASEVLGWLIAQDIERQVTDQQVRRILGKKPPIVNTLSHNLFSDMLLATGGEAAREKYELNGFYDRTLNAVFLNDQVPMEERHNGTLHEILHNLTVGSGTRIMRYGNTKIEYPDWMHEGFTELFAQVITRMNKPSNDDQPTYPHETMFATKLASVVGLGTLFRAYLTGDFNEVKRFVDSQLGEGTFENLINSNNGAEAYATLTRATERVKLQGSYSKIMLSMVADCEQEIKKGKGDIPWK